MLVTALDGPVERVAPTLLGGLLRHGEVVVRLTEVEAYDGAADPASHAFRGRTARTEVMFGPPGRLYVYFSYGMHWAANVVCGPDGTASGVLLRAGEVVEGLALARSRRGRASDRDLARGPGRLTQALGITADHKGTSIAGRRAGDAGPGPPSGRAGERRTARRGLGRGGPALALLAHRGPLRLRLQAQPARPRAAVITVPPALVRWRTGQSGDVGRRWLDGLPARVAALCAAWDLVVEDTPPLAGALALVVLVRRGEERLALRVRWPEPGQAAEVVALRAWDGRGAVRLVAVDPAGDALLLERLDPHRTLRDLPVERAAVVTGRLLAELSVPAPPGLPTLAASAAAFVAGGRGAGRGSRRDRSRPGRWPGPASSRRPCRPTPGCSCTGTCTAATCWPTARVGGGPSTRSRWSATRPSRWPSRCGPAPTTPRAPPTCAGCSGWWPTPRASTPTSAAGWTVVRAVDYWLWGLEHGLTEDPVRCARLVDALA